MRDQMILELALASVLSREPVRPSVVTQPQAPPIGNLLRNPGFDRDLSSWQVAKAFGAMPGPGRAVWSPLDAEKRSGSGSLEIRTSALSDRETYAVGQCINVDRPSEYAIFGGAIRVPPDQPVTGSATLALERFVLPDCAGSGHGQSGLGPVANADFWSKRIDRAMIQGSRSIRLLAAVTKNYEWLDGDTSGNRDDHVTFQAFFDGLFLRLADEKDLPEPPRAPTAGFSAAEAAPKARRRWGKHVVDPPKLAVRLGNAPGGGDAAPVLSSDQEISVEVSLQSPYEYEDPRRYPLDPLSVAAENVSRGLLGRPTLELVLYRSGDPAKEPLPITVSSSGGGWGEIENRQTSSIHVGVRLAGPSEFRTRTLRALWNCLVTWREARSEVPTTPVATPSDEQIAASPLASFVIANAPGEYELVARYLALAAGFWHEPIYSAPLTVRVVEKKLECGDAKVRTP